MQHLCIWHPDKVDPCSTSLTQWQHFLCLAHTLQIAIRAGLDLHSINSLSARCCKLVGHSYVGKASLEEVPRRLGLPVHKLIQEVSTRWNSTYEMYKRILEQKAAISAVLCSSTKAKDQKLMLTTTTSSNMECVNTVLKPLAVATEMWYKEKAPSITVVQPIVKTLLTPSEVEAKLVIDLKNANASNLQAHLCDTSRQKLMLVASARTYDSRVSRFFLHESAVRCMKTCQLY